MKKSTKEKFKTYKNVFDNSTRLVLEQLRSKRIIDELESPLFVGKESNVFTAGSKDGTVIVKIYRLETCDFKRMNNYLKYDYRYSHPRVKAGDFRRRIIFNWVHREHRNLLRARDGGVFVPTPLHATKNVLVLEFIGNDAPAPRLKDHIPTNPLEFFLRLIEEMKKLYCAGLVHADLSSYNILNLNEKPVLIDFSQATILENPCAKEYLERDCKNVCLFFKKLCVECDPTTLFQEIVKQKIKKLNT